MTTTTTTAIWELTAVRLGTNRAARIVFYVDRAEAEAAASQVQAEGFATRIVPITMPNDPKPLADLLAEYVGRLGVRMGR